MTGFREGASIAPEGRPSVAQGETLGIDARFPDGPQPWKGDRLAAIGRDGRPSGAQSLGMDPSPQGFTLGY